MPAKQPRKPIVSLDEAPDMTQALRRGFTHLPPATRTTWGRTAPDQPARTLLIVIARDPEAVKSSLRVA